MVLHIDDSFAPVCAWRVCVCVSVRQLSWAWPLHPSVCCSTTSRVTQNPITHTHSTSHQYSSAHTHAFQSLLEFMCRMRVLLCSPRCSWAPIITCPSGTAISRLTELTWAPGLQTTDHRLQLELGLTVDKCRSSSRSFFGWKWLQ